MPFNSKEGIYEYDDISKYIENSNDNIAYFIKDKDNIMGFILFDIIDGVNIIQEMFIMNNYKRNGIGKEAAKQLFNKHKGLWEIKSLPGSEQAEIFWKSVVKEYSNNNYVINFIGKYNRAVIKFDNNNKF